MKSFIKLKVLTQENKKVDVLIDPTFIMYLAPSQDEMYETEVSLGSKILFRSLESILAIGIKISEAMK